MAMTPNGKSPVTSDHDEKIMLFRDVTPGPHETQLHFRLIHFWEAWNPVKMTLIGLEMLLIDEQGSVIQGFISPGRIERYLPKMKPGSVYKLNNFYGSSNKRVYRVSDHAVTVSFSWNSELSVLEDSPTPFEEDRFRFHSFEDFQASCDRKGDRYVPPLLKKTDSDFIPLRIFKLAAIAKETSTVISVITHTISKLQCLMIRCDVVGHMKLVNGQSLIGTPVLDEVEIARVRHVLVHVQSHDGPVMKLYLWDQAARDFCKKFKSYEDTPTVLLVTTVNTKSLGGTNPQSAELVNAEVVTKWETLTIGEIFSYIKQGSTKEALLSARLRLMMWSMVQPASNFFSARYRAQISVYDNSEQAVFVLLGDAVLVLSILVLKLQLNIGELDCQANGNQEVSQEVPFPEALISTIGQKHKFCVKVTKHNLDGKSRSLTVTKILPLDTPPVTESLGENYNPATLEETFETGTNVCEASKISVDSAEGSKRNCDIDEMGKAKRLKCGV
ncbi:hypothetical protein F2Q69_00031077 [Brassica cretica]|uniref:DUF223 domain-containing protein n=1 Tax=Brassica cretica TaxID=69181 RepID=A0A8S9S0E7_BRACR|nr:hypothetical protein F2Q69_00031077 [Brassica cretica]